MLAGLYQGLPERLYLTCQVKEPPSVTVAELYRVPPLNHDALAMDLFKQGLVSLMEPPPETWEVDRVQKLIKAGPGNWSWTFNNAGFGTSEITGSLTTSGGTFISVTFNRISGVAETTIMRTDAASEAWRKEHGKPLPPTWTWKQQCTASQSPRF
jgi:hypothetical protein